MWQKYINAEKVEQVLEIIAERKTTSRIVAGGTDLILEMERGVHKNIETIIDISRISGLDSIFEDTKGIIHLGPLVTHNDCVGSALLREKALPLVMAAWEVGSPQIRNRGTIAGNIITASPANDTISPMMALGATLHLASVTGTRSVRLLDFYTGVRKTVLQPNEMVVDISFPAMKRTDHGIYLKNALRKAQAISIVNITIILKMADEIISEAVITLGAVSPVIIHAKKAEEYLKDKVLTPDNIEEAARLTGASAKPIDDLRGSAVYRSYITSVIAKRALLSIKNHENGDTLLHNPPILDTQNTINATSQQFGTITPDIPIITTINGQKYVLKLGQGKTLLRLLRDAAGLIGTKEGCAEGECGACTVYLDGAAVMACLVPAPRAHGANITTIEGIATGEKMHPVQQAFVDEGAVQCGYCTPGFVMSATKLLEENPTPSEIEIKQALTGNLCRCTGYYKIIRAVEKAARSL